MCGRALRGTAPGRDADSPTILDALSGSEDDDRDKHLDRLAQFRATAEERCRELRARLRIAEDLATTLRAHLPGD